MTKFFTNLVALMILPICLFAQVRTITGTVTSGDDKAPIPGVNVVVQGTSKGTVTDVDGKYSIELAPAENVLVFSFVGFTSQTVTVDQQTTINVELASDSKVLDEVVVVGYGTVRKSDLTGSVSSVKGEDLTKVPSVSPIQSLQGKVPGLQITSGSGAPGSAPIVRIRGTGTFNNANPIYVVDGVILDDINFLNSGDIESVEVLKDASSTAIYGSRGANGVIMVTTKKGKKGQGAPVINVSAEYSVQSLQKKIDLLGGRDFAIIANEINPGAYNNVDVVANTDWQDQLFRSAPIQNYQFSSSGASDKSQYYIGLGYFRQDGIIPKSSYERISLKFNNTYNLSKFVRLGSNITVTPYKQQNTNGNAPFVVYRAQPTITPYQSDGSFSPVPGVGNVLADIKYTNNFDRALRSVGNFYTEADLLKGLTFKSSIGVDMEFKKNKTFTPEFFVNPQQQNSMSRLNKTYGDRLSWLWENTLSYNKEIEKHRINAVVGYTMQESSSETLKVVGENILRDGPDFWYVNPDNINPKLVDNSVDAGLNYSMVSYLARANYTFDDRYLFTATFRRDGSSKFSKANRFANFPSFAVGWNAINESFLQENKLFSNLKLRASWGIIGNEKIDYKRQFSPVTNALGAVFGYNETLYPGSTYGVTGNQNLIWENTYQTDVGAELGFLNDRLTVEVDYYNKNTKGILISLPIPGFLGNGDGATITYNAAEVLNRGFEYNVAWASEVGDFRYKVSTIGTTIHNEATKVFGTGGQGDRLLNGSSTTATSPGLPLGSFYGYVVNGIFQNTSELNAYPHQSNAQVGDLRFVDVNNDGVLNSDDRTNIGSPIPTFLYGLSLSAGYKAFDLSADFQGQSGNKIYNAKETVRPDLYNFEQHVIDRWRGEGTSNTEPRATAGGYNWQPSTQFIQNGSFFRLRNLSIGYTLPSALSNKIKVHSARLYVRGTNVFTLTKFTGYSPEVASATAIDNGIDNSTYPVSAIYSMGVNLTF
jgi:TonB-linked SusC/RagA family outer membrane protein